MTVPAVIRVQGKLVTFLAAVLDGAGVKPAEEFAAQLGLFAVTVGETEAEEGEMLAYWAAMVRDFANLEAALCVEETLDQAKQV